MKRYYFDYNATTPVLQETQEYIHETLKKFGNPSSLYYEGREAKEEMELARERVADYFGTTPPHVIFTSSGSESNNMVIKSIIFEAILTHTPVHIITTAIEHSSVMRIFDAIPENYVRISIVGVDAKGHVNCDDIASEICPETRLISVQMANNEVGSIQPINEIATLAREQGILCHSDAVQAAGKVRLDFDALGLDFASISGHKVYAPKGVGVLLCKDDTQLLPLISGASHERKKRAGTESIAMIAGLGFSLFKHPKSVDYSEQRDTIVSFLKTKHSEAIIHTPLDMSLSNTLSMSFPGIDGHALAINLDLCGIAVSTGSACSVGSVEPSSVLRAMGVSDEINRSTIRISLGKFVTNDMCLELCNSLSKSIDRMRGC